MQDAVPGNIGEQIIAKRIYVLQLSDDEETWRIKWLE